MLVMVHHIGIDSNQGFWSRLQQGKRLQERDTPVNQTNMTRISGVFADPEKEFPRFTVFMTTELRTDNGH